MSHCPKSTHLGTLATVPYVYILRCSDATFCTGSTDNLERRLAQYQLGEGAISTRKHRPVELVLAEYFDSIAEAFAVRRRSRAGSHGKKAALVTRDTGRLRELARRRSRPRLP